MLSCVWMLAARQENCFRSAGAMGAARAASFSAFRFVGARGGSPVFYELRRDDNITASYTFF